MLVDLPNRRICGGRSDGSISTILVYLAPMNPFDDEREQSPRWVPYTPPPPDGWERVWFALRRLSFPFVVLLFVGGLVWLFYWSAETGRTEDARPVINVVPSEGQRTGGLGGAGVGDWAQFSVESTPPGAAVRLNGDSVGATPFVDSTMQAGVYMLTVRAQGYARVDTVIDVRRGGTATLHFTLRPRPRYATGASESSSPSRGATARSPEQTSRRPLPITSVPARETDQRPSSSPTEGGLYVTSTPTGAVVTVGGTERGRTPLPVENISAGTSRVHLSLEGYEPWRASIEVAENRTRRVHADLEQRPGRLRILARPWGTIYVNETLHARESDVWYETQLPPGSHRITVVHPVLGEKRQEVQIRSDEETSIVVDLQSQGESGTTP